MQKKPTQIHISTEYPRVTMMVSSTAYPSGDVYKYENGRPRYNLLPSNHPLVLAEASRRVKNTMRKSRGLVKEAGVIVQMASKRLKTGSK